VLWIGKSLISLGIMVTIIGFVTVSTAYASPGLPLWDKSSYNIGESATITLQETTKKLYSNYPDVIYITVSSDSFKDGISLALIETENNSGIFIGKISITSAIDSEDSLIVQEGDSVYAINGGFIHFAKIHTKKSFSNSNVLVTTDKKTYENGEIIRISGKVANGNPNFPVILTIIDPNGVIILKNEYVLASDKRFDAIVDTDYFLLKEPGNYLIRALHGTDSIGETAISFNAQSDLIPRKNSIEIFGTAISLKYSKTFGELYIVKPVYKSNALQFSIDGKSGGHLTVELPRTLIDAKADSGVDENFEVLVNGKKIRYYEKANHNERTLTIPYLYKSKTIEVKGTFLDTNSEVPPLRANDYRFPEWIRVNADWWSKGLLDDEEFVYGIQYLINQGLMRVPHYSGLAHLDSTPVPNWVKDNAGWWAKKQITDQDFVNGIQYLIENGIIRI